MPYLTTFSQLKSSRLFPKLCSPTMHIIYSTTASTTAHPIRFQHSRLVHTPCSSSLRSCSGTLGELRASRRHWMFSSGTTYSSTSFRGRPRAVPCLAVEGTASSRIAPRKVVNWWGPEKENWHWTLNAFVTFSCLKLSKSLLSDDKTVVSYNSGSTYQTSM